METHLEFDNFTQNVSVSAGNQSGFQHSHLRDVILTMAPFGALANIFTFYVLTKHRPQTSNTCILRVLSIVDTLVLCTYFTHTLADKYWGRHRSIDLQMASIFIAHILQNCSSYVLVVLSFDRFVLICHALHARKWCTIRNTRRTLSVMSVFPLLYVIFFFIGPEIPLISFSNAVTLTCAVAILAFNTRIAAELILSARRRVLLTARQATKPPTGFIVNLSVVATLYILLSIPQLWFWYILLFESGHRYDLFRWPWIMCNCINHGRRNRGAGGAIAPPNILPTQKIQDCKNNDI